MSKYTIDIYTMMKDEDFYLFDFAYDFYTDDVRIRKNFEKKFIDRYMFNEIGFETVRRFKHFLKTRLNIKMCYYKQLYYTELKSKDIEFLLNKDLKETFIREVEGKANNINESLSNSNNKYKESSLDNGNATLDYETSLTNVSNTNDNTSVNTSSDSSNKEHETTSLISRGNIGITSSAELLQKWREVLINIDELIINDCSDLFMQIY